MESSSGGRPFLLISTRDDPVAAEDEVRGFLAASGLSAGELAVHALDAAPLPQDLDPGDYSGILLGGGPFNSSDDPASKSMTQLRVESELAALLDVLVERDFPFLGACYGVGTLGTHQGGTVDRAHAEPVGTTRVELTAAGAADPITAGMPRRFEAFVGHKEALSRLPADAVLLATSATCPVQMFRVRTNLYATQFHPELDGDGLATRIAVYRDAGYFPADQADGLARLARSAEVSWPSRVLQNFVRRYRC
ncbi:glutamine amidotransferase [Arthrobacter sp. JSM 101049]|uniref:glutamine amidotransferase n=1 Tax=Arthrobacter sp. JSM 101049 TaxID=929097 RepID=UPI00356583E0